VTRHRFPLADMSASGKLRHVGALHTLATPSPPSAIPPRSPTTPAPRAANPARSPATPPHRAVTPPHRPATPARGPANAPHRPATPPHSPAMPSHRPSIAPHRPAKTTKSATCAKKSGWRVSRQTVSGASRSESKLFPISNLPSAHSAS
jgi:hypothetical protein